MFYHLLTGGLIGLKYQRSKTLINIENREDYLYNNVGRIIEKDTNAILFCQMGRAHVPISFQEKWLHLANWSSLAARLNSNENSPLKGKVCSILHFYPSDTLQDSYHEPLIKSNDVPVFMKYSTSPITIFKLDAPETPFKEMSEKFQYLIINKY